MKFILPLLVAISVCTADLIKEPTLDYQEGNRFFYFPGDGDGINHLVDTEKPADFDFINEYARNPNNNEYWLYTRKNPNVTQVLRFGDAQSVHNSYFDKSNDTVFLVHGWLGNGESPFIKELTSAFLEDSNANVIVLEWNRLANRDYVTARNAVVDVGRGLGQFVTWLTTLGVPYKKIHLVGYSLGGQLVGNAGKETNGLVGRITALDPAGPLFLPSNNDHITSIDGQYVEVIHTNTAFFGYSGLCGDADFYPNGGYIMPGCRHNSCSHSKAYEYMVSSLRHNHLYANECDSLRDAEMNRCNGSLYLMGSSDLGKSRAGIFRINTGIDYPYTNE